MGSFVAGLSFRVDTTTKKRALVDVVDFSARTRQTYMLMSTHEEESATLITLPFHNYSSNPSAKRFSLSKTRKFKIVVATLIVFLIVSVVYLAQRIYFSNPQKGQFFPPVAWAPTLEIGDSWTLALTSNEANYNLTMTVTGKETVNNVSCYAMKLVFEPESPLAKKGVSNEMTWWLDNSTLHLVKVKGKAHAYGYDLTFVEKHFYTFQGEPFLTVGNEHNETDNRKMNVYGPPPTNLLFKHEETTATTRIKGEAVENITVPAGTFSCYKIVTYDETGQNTLSIRWFSMEAKTAVKTENYEIGEFEMSETAELLFYSV